MTLTEVEFERDKNISLEEVIFLLPRGSLNEALIKIGDQPWN